MSRVRYEVFLAGRLLRVTDRVQVTSGRNRAREPAEENAGYIDGRYEWRVDDTPVAEDVARAMLAEKGWELTCDSQVIPMPGPDGNGAP